MTTQRYDGDNLERTVTTLSVQVGYVTAAVDRLVGRVDALDRRLNDYGILSEQIAQLKDRMRDTQQMVADVRREGEEARRWQEQMKQQFEQLSDTRTGRISSTYVALIAVGVTVMGIIFTALFELATRGGR